MLMELFADSMRYADEVVWNAEAERVDAYERLLYQDLVLEERRSPRADPALVAEKLAEAALARGPRAFAEDGALDRLLERLAFVARTVPDAGLSAPGDAELRDALRRLCEGRRSFAELREVGLDRALREAIPPQKLALLERLAPERVTLPGGRSVRVHYESSDKPPHVESRLQDFFGMRTGPAVAGGRVPLVLHLLAPSQRPVQVTTDLAGFWERHYPSIRRELMRRYPRHSWPEDPLAAQPPAPSRRR
jgi:ATP-dependent helicase HrpB